MYKNLYFVYIASNIKHTVLYTGVTHNLIQRIYQHKNKLVDGFTQKYNVTQLLYYESYPDIYQAILREKQIKAGSRKKKIELIEKRIHFVKIFTKKYLYKIASPPIVGSQ